VSSIKVGVDDTQRSAAEGMLIIILLLEHKPAEALAASDQSAARQRQFSDKLAEENPEYREWRRNKRCVGADYWPLFISALAHHDLGHAHESQQALDDLVKCGEKLEALIATVHAWRGEHDDAITWFERAFAERSLVPAGAGFPPLDQLMLRDLPDDPRFQALVRRTGREPASMRPPRARL
jgi:hypothetical protein